MSKRINILISDKMYEVLKEKLSNDVRTLSGVVRDLLKKYIESEVVMGEKANK